MGRSARRKAFASTLAVVGCIAVSGVGRIAQAQQPAPSRGDLAAAQALFDDAKRLMDAKRFAEACPKLAESQRLDPGGGTTLVIAICHEGEGKLATAWADYNQALTEARRDKRADRERAASAKVDELAPRLPRVQITPTGNEPGLEIKRDGVVVGRAQWGTPVPIDPGDYVFEASAPGKAPWRGAAKIVAEPKIFNIMIPVLSTAPVAVAGPAGSTPAASPAATGVASDHPGSPTAAPSSDRWLVTGIVGGVGLVAAAVGGVIGFSAKSTWDTVKSSCPSNRCPTDALVQDAKSVGGRADLATGLVIVGGAALVSAVIINLAWPEPSASRAALRAAPYVSRDGAGVAVGGTL